MYLFIVALLAFVLVTPAHAQVHVDIGIHLPAPPQLIVVPEVRAVQYAPAAPANIFFYSGQYWALANGGWHVSGGYNGPWIVVAPQFVPRPILLVPVNHYRIPPGHWKQWAKHQPPRWGDECSESGSGLAIIHCRSEPTATNDHLPRAYVGLQDLTPSD